MISEIIQWFVHLVFFEIKPFGSRTIHAVLEFSMRDRFIVVFADQLIKWPDIVIVLIDGSQILIIIVDVLSQILI